MTNDQPKVSILIPAKNAEKYLHDCLSSIRGQTFSFWELIIVDDHSKDGTERIIREFCTIDDRISLFKNPGKGIIPALQKALSHARGYYITRFDADDVMPPSRLEQMVHAISSLPQKSIVTGKVKYFGEKPVSEGYLIYETWINKRIEQHDHWNWVYRECVIASPNWMVRTEDLRSTGGFDGLSYPEDYDLVLRWYANDFTVIGLNETTLFWREHPERTSRNSVHYDQEHFFDLKVRHFIRNRFKGEPLVLWGAGTKSRITAKIFDEHEVDFQWMDLHPEKYPTGIDGHAILPFSAIEGKMNALLLLSVYPNKNERNRLESYLRRTGFVIGKNYWYL